MSKNKYLAPEDATQKKGNFKPIKILIYVVCIFLSILSLYPFIVMIVNATRENIAIQNHPLYTIPDTYLFKNFRYVNTKFGDFKPWKGFVNSLIISGSSTILALYFSTLTAYAVVVYDWKLNHAFFTFVLAVMMIPGQVVSIGFYKMVFNVGLANNYLPLIIPSIAAPSTVFFMRQYMIPSLSKEIIQAARIDGAREFRIFNTIALPIMKPALATQGIFTFVTSWNSLFMPSILLRDKLKYTMPQMASLLVGDSYKQDWGAIYLSLGLTVLPILIVYLLLSRYIIAGVALGSVKG